MLVAAAPGCEGSQDPTIGGSGPHTPAPVATSSSPVDEPTAPGGSPQAQRIEVTVSGGEVDGPGTVTIQAGQQVELAVTSDAADHVHVHGYDVLKDVAAGETATLTFTADIPGVFEVELEESGTQLLELQVTG